MDWLGNIHFVAALLSLASGLIVLLTQKGTPGHRKIGWVYAAAMGTVNITALMIYDLFGGFGPFHVAAILSSLTMIMGLLPAIRRKPKRQWIVFHAYWMAWSYVGLMAAAASEISTRYFHLHFGLAVATATIIVIFLGWMLVRTRVPLILKSYGLGA